MAELDEECLCFEENKFFDLKEYMCLFIKAYNLGVMLHV